VSSAAVIIIKLIIVTGSARYRTTGSDFLTMDIHRDVAMYIDKVGRHTCAVSLVLTVH